MVKGSRVVGYVRCSTHEQADSGLGIAAQRAAIADECERRGWQLVDVIEDPAHSGKNARRPGLDRVRAMLRRHEVDGLVVAKLDRLTRSLSDFASIMETAQAERWSLVVLDLNIDTTTPTGEAMVGMLAVFAQWERRIIGQRTRDALAAAKARGTRLGNPHLGTSPATVVRRIRRARDRGDSLQAIADALNNAGVPTAQGGSKWYPSSIKAVLDRHGAS